MSACEMCACPAAEAARDMMGTTWESDVNTDLMRGPLAVGIPSLSNAKYMEPLPPQQLSGDLFVWCLETGATSTLQMHVKSQQQGKQQCKANTVHQYGRIKGIHPEPRLK